MFMYICICVYNICIYPYIYGLMMYAGNLATVLVDAAFHPAAASKSFMV